MGRKKGRRAQGQAAEPLPGEARPPGAPVGRRVTPAVAGVQLRRWAGK